MELIKTGEVAPEDKARRPRGLGHAAVGVFAVADVNDRGAGQGELDGGGL